MCKYANGGAAYILSSLFYLPDIEPKRKDGAGMRLN